MTPQKEVTPCGTLAPTFVQIVDLAREWTTSVLENVSGFEDVYSTAINEVENEHRDGFIPYTDGGFDGIGYATLSGAWGTGCEPAVVKPYIEQSLKDAAEEWDRKNPDCTVAMIYATPEPVALEEVGQLPLPGLVDDKSDWERRQHPRLEEFQNFETESMQEGGTYFYKVRVLFHGDRHRSESGEPEAYFMVGINTDFEYGRDNIPWLACYGSKTQQTEWVWEKTVKIADLTSEMIDEFIAEASKALREA